MAGTRRSNAFPYSDDHMTIGVSVRVRVGCDEDIGAVAERVERLVLGDDADPLTDDEVRFNYWRCDR